MSEDILVTGGSGSVGQPIVRALVAAGHRVRMLTRRDESARRAIVLGARPVRGDLLEPGALARATQGATVVVHAASSWTSQGSHEEHARINVTGTGLLLEAARAAGVRRVVHISDASVVIDGARPTDGDERLPVVTDASMPYSSTKAAAEKLALGASTDAMATLALRPAFVWGEEAPELAALSRAFRQRQYVWIGRGTHAFSVTHADNLARAVVQALHHGRGGQAYFVTDDEVTSLKSFITDLVATQGLQAEARTVPRWLAECAARTFAQFPGLRPARRPSLTVESVRMLGQGLHLSSDLARRELGYQPVVSRVEGMERLAALSRSHGKLMAAAVAS
ncbi:MAG: NAD-dependent epimerase/dehydratase family protein [Myxococcales bacterium]|nr:MAG: NAD-dependent epimerase/dehydratase family protein [Myxococcales bacterium]